MTLQCIANTFRKKHFLIAVNVFLLLALTACGGGGGGGGAGQTGAPCVLGVGQLDNCTLD